MNTPPKTLEWVGGPDGYFNLLDQTRLPMETVILKCTGINDVYAAIQRLSVRGAPAIGVSAAFGVILGLQQAVKQSTNDFLRDLDRVCDYLATSRPTAVNLFWALERMRKHGHSQSTESSISIQEALLKEARLIQEEDEAMCAAMGRFGAALLKDGDGVLTHCNTGALATAGEGTALAVIIEAARSGKSLQVFADETRPLLQGARLTTWELMQRDIPVTLICDSMAGWVMKQNKVQAVITGADRIAANGDAANKIGTYAVSVLAKAHGIPFYVAAPSSTFDFQLESGENIPIEERDPKEIINGFGTQTAPSDVSTFNPAFDVTPAENITALITERGLIQPVTTEQIAQTLRSEE